MSEDGSKLWLRYAPLGNFSLAYRIGKIEALGESPTMRIIRDELQSALSSMLGETLPASDGLPLVVLKDDKSEGGAEGFAIRSDRQISITSQTEIGALHGVF